MLYAVAYGFFFYPFNRDGKPYGTNTRVGKWEEVRRVIEGKKLKTEPCFPLLHHLPTDWPQLHNWLAQRPWSHLTQLHKSCVGGVGVHNFFNIFFDKQKWQKKSPNNLVLQFAPQSEKLLNNQHLWQLLLPLREKLRSQRPRNCLFLLFPLLKQWSGQKPSLLKWRRLWFIFLLLRPK